MPANATHYNVMTGKQSANLTQFWTTELTEELLRFFSGRVKCPELAAELTNDTYLHLRQAVDRQQPDNLRALTFRIAVNQAIDHQRKMQVREKHDDVSTFDVENAAALTSAQPEEILAGRQHYKILQEALDELPVICRTIFILHGIDGLSYQEIADRLQVSKSLVNKLLSQAMRHCAARLQTD